MAVPFLNWLVDIMVGSSRSRRLIFSADLRGVNPAQTRRYYRTVSLPVSLEPRWDNSTEGEPLIAEGGLCSSPPPENVSDRGDITVGAHARDYGVHRR
jgi:hypothetical protein